MLMTNYDILVEIHPSYVVNVKKKKDGQCSRHSQSLIDHVSACLKAELKAFI